MLELEDTNEIFIEVMICWSDTDILESNQVKRTPQDYINEFIIWILNPLVGSRMQ